MELILLSKRAQFGDKLHIFHFLFLLVLLGIGIVAGFWIASGEEYDFREGEAALLNMKIRECIYESYVNYSFFEHIFEVCGLDKEVTEKYFLVRVCKNSEDCILEDKGMFDIGANLKICKIKGYQNTENELDCMHGFTKKKEINFEIITASKQILRRVGT